MWPSGAKGDGGMHGVRRLVVFKQPRKNAVLAAESICWGWTLNTIFQAFRYRTSTLLSQYPVNKKNMRICWNLVNVTDERWFTVQRWWHIMSAIINFDILVCTGAINSNSYIFHPKLHMLTNCSHATKIRHRNLLT